MGPIGAGLHARTGVSVGGVSGGGAEEQVSTDFDCVVIGGGHAGCEAALAAARMGARVLLLSSNLERLGYLPCNSGVGGPAKGHVVRELAALGGEMPYNVDRTFTQIRLLNTSKGAAVRALRAQADKSLYPLHMKAALEGTPTLTLRQGMATGVEATGGSVTAVRTQDGGRFTTRAAIVTVGTFLEARLLAGEWQAPGGRAGDPPAHGLSASLQGLGFRLTRMQTNTPPRIDARTVDFALTEEQQGSERPLYFGLYYDRPVPEPPFAAQALHPVYPVSSQTAWRAQAPCYVVRTIAETHRLARASLHRSPIVAGISQGSGPRYCPSFEEKLVRYPERESHPLILEPEGYGTAEMYVQGLFTAFPVDVQEALLHSIPALRRAHITRPGYAVEYDVLQPGQFDPALQARGVRGLYFAGQVNGTSGYEEAAGQGWLAGANAVLGLRDQEPAMLRRDQAYIGVMVDDLITKEHREPYRLFTATAEFRLLLRQDSADLRLSGLAHRLGLVSDVFAAAVDRKRAQVTAELDRLRLVRVPVRGAAEAAYQRRFLGVPADPPTGLQLLRWPEVGYDLVEELAPPPEPLSPEARETVEVEAKYAGYIERQETEVNRWERLERRRVPPGLDFRTVIGLRTEARERFLAATPLTVGQAARLPGVTPSDVAVLLAHLERGMAGEAGSPEADE